MNKEEFIKAVSDLIGTYVVDEELYDDSAQLVVNPDTHEASLADGDEEIDDSLDQYDVMDMVRMDADGKWIVDNQAVSDLADEYSF